MRHWIRRNQRTTFLIASGLSTAGSFAGLTAKGWILMDQTSNPLLLALHFGALAMPSLLASGSAGVLTDRIGCERVLIRSQWGLVAGAALGAVAIPWLTGAAQVSLLLLSTLVVGLASAFELTARNKYCALLVDEPAQLAPYLTSFSVVFNVGKLVGPPIGGLLLALTGPATALTIDAASYLLPVATVLWLLQPDLSAERRSGRGVDSSLASAWRGCGASLRHVLMFTGLACLAVFFHPGLAPLIAAQVLGPSPQSLGWFTSVLAAGSISAGLLLQRRSQWLSERPSLLLDLCRDHQPRPAGHGSQCTHGLPAGDDLSDRSWDCGSAGGQQPDPAGGSSARAARTDGRPWPDRLPRRRRFQWPDRRRAHPEDWVASHLRPHGQHWPGAGAAGAHQPLGTTPESRGLRSA